MVVKRMKILFILWLGCIFIMIYHIVISQKAGIYPSKRVLQLRAKKWGIVASGLFFIWFVIILFH